jgi:hypothetical protein
MTRSSVQGTKPSVEQEPNGATCEIEVSMICAKDAMKDELSRMGLRYRVLGNFLRSNLVLVSGDEQGCWQPPSQALTIP